MKVTCHQCGIEFEKEEKEVRRQRKEGRDYFFCSRSCTGIYANQVRHNSPQDGLKPHQRRTKRIEELLGEKLSTAKSRLNKRFFMVNGKLFDIVNHLATSKTSIHPTFLRWLYQIITSHFLPCRRMVRRA